MKTIAVIFGSRSAEHDISIVTAISCVIRPLEVTKKYRVEAVYIAKNGSWYMGDEFKDIKLYQSDKIATLLQKSTKVQLLFDKGLYLVKPSKSKFLTSKRVKVDVVFPATHGTHGEDGELMGLLEMANVPYVGCDLPSSAIAMDKVSSKLIAEAHKIKTPKMIYFSKTDYLENSKKYNKEIQTNLKGPLFVKPAHLGSSIGITRVDTTKELINAIELALYYDDKILVEEAVSNLIEVTVPVMGNHDVTTSLVEQPVSMTGKIFDFEKKYMNQGGGKKIGSKQGAQGYSKIPAEISEELIKKSIQTTKNVYKAIGCKGLARIDLLIDKKSGEVYFNEINPLPGSLYAHNWRAKGMSNVQLVSKLIELAEQNWQEKSELSNTFKTNFLKQF